MVQDKHNLMDEGKRGKNKCCKASHIPCHTSQSVSEQQPSWKPKTSLHSSSTSVSIAQCDIASYRICQVKSAVSVVSPINFLLTPSPLLKIKADDVLCIGRSWQWIISFCVRMFQLLLWSGAELQDYNPSSEKHQRNVKHPSLLCITFPWYLISLRNHF